MMDNVRQHLLWSARYDAAVRRNGGWSLRSPVLPRKPHLVLHVSRPSPDATIYYRVEFEGGGSTSYYRRCARVLEIAHQRLTYHLTERNCRI